MSSFALMLRSLVVAAILISTNMARGADKPVKGKPAPAALAPAAPAADPLSTAPAQPTGPFGAPDEQSVARAMKTIKQTYGAEYAAATALAPRAALAARLYKESQETRDDNAARYVLLCEARDWAAKAGDSALAVRAIEDLSRMYGVSSGEMTIKALRDSNVYAITPAAQEALARSAMSAADNAVARDDFDTAARLIALADPPARLTHKIVLITDVQDKAKEINWARTEYEKARQAMETLSTRPEDKDARAAAGRFKCLAKNDWERGLPLLLECSDAEYQRLAQRDLAAASAGPAQQHEIGNDWWDVGDKLTGRARISCRTRAAYWYRKALPGLAGISRTSVEKRLEDLDAARLREMHLTAGLVGDYFAGQTFANKKTTRIDPAIDFEWPGAPIDGMPRDDFSVRWSGYLRAPAGGKYTLTLFANEGARVYIDDKLAVEEPDGQRKRKGVSAVIPLTEGLHPIRVDFWDGGGLARVRLLWQPPGAQAEEPIPAKFFVHEMSAGR